MKRTAGTTQSKHISCVQLSYLSNSSPRPETSDWELRFIIHKNVLFSNLWTNNLMFQWLMQSWVHWMQFWLLIVELYNLKLILVLLKSHLWITYTVDNCEWSPRDTISRHTWPHGNHWRSIDNAKNCDNCTYEPWAWKLFTF